MLTARGWWLLLAVLAVALIGLLARLPLVALSGLALLGWFAWEWLYFAIMAGAAGRGLVLSREVCDDRGPVGTLWAGRSFLVRVELGARRLRLAHVLATDAVPFGVERESGEATAEGPLDRQRPLRIEYRVRCGRPGVARFEGVRVRAADLQGFFYLATFVRAPVELPVLPALLDAEGRPASRKRYNLLPPPGVHHLRVPGSGSELLDLRDYLPGDPPKTIAWKISARRDRLITREYESEVPVRCTLFVDASASVRVPAPEGPAVARLAEIAAGVVQSASAVRDLTGVCVFDEHGVRAWARPARSGRHLTQVLRLLADAAALPPAPTLADPEPLLPLAFAFAREVYPELLAPAVNAMPFWVRWFAPFPRYTRRRATLAQLAHRRKNLAWFFCPPVVSAVIYLALLAVSERMRRLARWRKQLAALFAVRYRLGPGGLAALLEDDDQLAIHLQRFLGEHRVPFAVALYDDQGRYQFLAPGKVDILAGALLRAVARGRDNELFVLMADLLELDDQLGPLSRAVRVALARHHQVVLICPWPAGLELPGRDSARVGAEAAPDPEPPGDLWQRAAQRRFHAAYHRLRRGFARLGVSVVCAASSEAVPLVLDRMERLHRAGRKP